MNVVCLGVWVLSCKYACCHGCGDGSVMHVCGGGGAFGRVVPWIPNSGCLLVFGLFINDDNDKDDSDVFTDDVFCL